MSLMLLMTPRCSSLKEKPVSAERGSPHGTTGAVMSAHRARGGSGERYVRVCDPGDDRAPRSGDVVGADLRIFRPPPPAARGRSLGQRTSSRLPSRILA